MSAERFITNLLIVGFLIEVAVMVLWAYPDVLRTFRREHGRQSPIFVALVVMDTLAVIVCLFFVPPSIDALGFFEFRLPFLGAGITLGVMLLAAGVIAHRLAFDYVRRRRGRVSEPESTVEEGDPE